MQTDFWTMFNHRTDALEAALTANDGAALSELIDQLAECLINTDPRLNINIGGPDPFRLAILSLPGAEQTAQSFVDGATIPEGWDVAVGLPEFDPIESVQVQDEDGDLLSVRYGDLDARVLPPRQGLVSIIFSLDTDFDPSGPRSHLFQAVAEHVVFTVLGGWPPELEKAVLLPRSQTGPLRPLEQLRQQWLDVVCSDRSS